MTQCMLHDREVMMIFMSVIKHNFRNGLIQAARVPPGDDTVVDSTTRESVGRLALHLCRCSTKHTAVHEARH